MLEEGVGKRIPNGTGQGTKLQDHINTIKGDEIRNKPPM